jgi:glycosyl hydrolase family 79
MCKIRLPDIAIWLALSGCGAAFAGAEPAITLTPAQMPRIGRVDARFQSYNIEMVEVTGGRFWAPYAQRVSPSASQTSAAQEAVLYAERPPIDLANARLRRLAGALGPAYLRVSGTWANATYVAATDAAPAPPPEGFNGVLTPPQWRGVVDFARAVDARIVTSFAISPGTRDAAGLWTPDQARRLLALTRAAGGRIAAAEFMNEPDLTGISAAPKGYDATAYRSDFDVFHRFAKQAAPEMMILGPGTVGAATAGASAPAALLAASRSHIDIVSYHHYGTVSERCGGAHTPEAALSEAWLARTDQALAFATTLRDRFAPGKPVWLTETAEAACGGNRWAASYLDTFRYLDQLGRLARAGVQVVMHNTLAASDYGLLDEATLAPRPNYWGALLWRRLMGATVLASGVPIAAGLHVYAHCLRGAPGGVAVLVINTARATPHTLTLANASQRYTLEAATSQAGLQDASVRLNGRILALGEGDALPDITGVAVASGAVTFAPASITFLAVPKAGNGACR